MKIILDVIENTGITATAGIGTNLYLCKVATVPAKVYVDGFSDAGAIGEYVVNVHFTGG